MKKMFRRHTGFTIVMVSTFLWCSVIGVFCVMPQALAASVDTGGSEGALSAAPSSDRPLVPRASDAERKKTISAANLKNCFRNRIEIKFREGSGIRSKDGNLAVVASEVRGEPPYAEFNQVQAILDKLNGYQFLRMHKLSEEKLQTMKDEGEKASGKELPDLNLWYYLYVDVDSLDALADVINQLNALDIVEFAYASDLPAPPPSMNSNATEYWEEYWQANSVAPWPTKDEIEQREAGMDPAPLSPPAPGTESSAPTVRLTVEPPPAPGNYEPFQDYGEDGPGRY